ncbi:chemotaxis response regulator protein-glutamate methylesterase [Candidatus Sulfurimonas marisnigri]|uniref:Protein-glutamate methylesterase/protein-glutamine glutaminase n=1 Tax=Candidatus Sulfurimonas marisnigri TaxID=2740405 RepID=A0A7S7RRI0_9BACT|nr:chemotaxis response regulator protein-glutamate methylesterase [Candidatus Sulfurimonas marisnigri]QOY55784.1 chemotaxis response regulator protein-glutamate methylesterase [Candidatus Sulfurimonas marisnigri]
MGIKVLVVDDSATARAILTDILESDSEIESVMTAPDAYVARDKILKYKPDVICLDVEMPRMDGITFLRKLMKYMPIPVVMVSSITKKGARTTLDALEAGAVDFVAKPHSNIYENSDEIRSELLEKVKSAAMAQVNKDIKIDTNRKVFYKASTLETPQKLIVLGSSTGGVEALRLFLAQFPSNSPAILLVQHMPVDFTKQFAQRLNSTCKMDVKEAKDGDTLEIGQVLIAPGDKHMTLKRSGHRYYVHIGGREKVSGHCPSVDVMFNSVSKVAGANAVGVILTGMGSDGAKGLLNMSKSGAMTFGQDKQSSTVYGMPKAAYELGGVKKQNSLDKLPKDILDYYNQDNK